MPIFLLSLCPCSREDALRELGAEDLTGGMSTRHTTRAQTASVQTYDPTPYVLSCCLLRCAVLCVGPERRRGLCTCLSVSLLTLVCVFARTCLSVSAHICLCLCSHLSVSLYELSVPLQTLVCAFAYTCLCLLLIFVCFVSLSTAGC